MTAILKRVEQEALMLSGEERAFLADRLLSSLDGIALNECDLAWITEADRRYDEYHDGKRIPVPAESVFAEADRMLG
jgi:putative addiction module component (TIGR02574 family)